MIEQNVIELLIKAKIAKNQFQAMHIANNLKLYQLDTEEACLERARLYRAWRNSQIFPDKDTASCYEKAIAGEAVPQMDFQQMLKEGETVKDEGEQLADYFDNLLEEG